MFELNIYVFLEMNNFMCRNLSTKSYQIFFYQYTQSPHFH